MSGARSLGFTLIELVVTIALAAVVLTLGVPNFRNMVLTNRMTTEINELVADLTLARNEAVTRNVPVTLCKRNSNGTNCLSSDDVYWTQGWIVFVDQNGDKDFDDDLTTAPCQKGEDCMLRVRAPLEGTLTLKKPPSSKFRVTYDSKGFTAGYNGTFTFCDDRGAKHAHGLILSPTGRLKTTDDRNDKEIDKDGDGNSLACP